jgi:uncharacterized phiE125 gp8 family phage protein
MQRHILSAPQVEPVSLAETKLWLRVDHSEDDSLILNLIRTARERVEARTGRAIISQTWRVSLDCWPADDAIALPIAPVESVLALRVKQLSGADIIVSMGSLRLLSHQEPALLLTSQRPATDYARAGIEIDLVAGYGPSGVTCPPSLRQAILLIVGHLYEARGPQKDVATDASIRAETDALLRPYMSIRLSGAMR